MFLPVRSVGVMGMAEHDWVVSLRAVETIDFSDRALGAPVG